MHGAGRCKFVDSSSCHEAAPTPGKLTPSRWPRAAAFMVPENSSMAQVQSSVLGLAVAAGLNLYAAVLMVGFGLRFGWISGLPGDLNVLANPIVLSVAGVLYALEFFADKVPFVSVAWDSVHTFIRPLGGAALALASTAKLSPEVQALAMLAAGSVALGTHSTKMSYRLLAHAHHSSRSATMGSSPAARRAGSHAPNTATKRNTTAIAA